MMRRAAEGAHGNMFEMKCRDVKSILSHASEQHLKLSVVAVGLQHYCVQQFKTEHGEGCGRCARKQSSKIRRY